MKEKDKIKDVKQEEVVEKVEKEEAGSDKSQKSNGLALIVVLLIIIACLGGVIYYLGNGKDDDSNTEKDNNKQESKVSSPELKSEYRLGGNGLENFDIHFLQIENKEENKVYSPLSIKYALEMLAEGADGDSKAQLDAIIGDYVAKKYTNSKNMSFANAFLMALNLLSCEALLTIVFKSDFVISTSIVMPFVMVNRIGLPIRKSASCKTSALMRLLSL